MLSRVRWFVVGAAWVLMSVIVGGCHGADSRTPVSSTMPTSPAVGEWVWDGLVLGRGDEAVACFGPVALSLPPAGCGGWPVRGWDWATTPGVSVLGVLSGEPVREAVVHLTVRVDGDELVLTRPIVGGSDSQSRAPCATIGDRDPQPEEWSNVEALLRSDGAKAAGVYPDNISVTLGGFVLDPPARLSVSLLVDTLSVRAWLLDAFGRSMVEFCAALQPVTK